MHLGHTRVCRPLAHAHTDQKSSHHQMSSTPPSGYSSFPSQPWCLVSNDQSFSHIWFIHKSRNVVVAYCSNCSNESEVCASHLILVLPTCPITAVLASQKVWGACYASDWCSCRWSTCQGHLCCLAPLACTEDYLLAQGVASLFRSFEPNKES